MFFFFLFFLGGWGWGGGECNSTARCCPEGLRSEECLASRFTKHFGEHRVNLPDALATRNVLHFCCLFHEMGFKNVPEDICPNTKNRKENFFFKLAGCVLEHPKIILKHF